MNTDTLEHTTLIDPTKVHELFASVLFEDSELENGKPINADDIVFVTGVMKNFGFNRQRLDSIRPDVEKMLDAVPAEFFIENKRPSHLDSAFVLLFDVGASFIRLCYDRDGNQWADLHATAEEFLVLCKALGYAVFTLPSSAWSVFPGGVPWIVFRKRPLDPVAIDDWNKKLVAIEELVLDGRAGDSAKAAEAFSCACAMVKGLE